MINRIGSQLRGAGEERMLDYEGRDVYVPPYRELADKAGLAPRALDGETVTIPAGLFRFLMSAWLRRLPFDTRHYLDANPDLRAAQKAGTLRSAHAHFVWTGYYEGRTPCEESVDEAFYLREYPDVARAVQRGQVRSAAEHYRNAGRAEGRAASDGQKAMRQEWSSVLLK